MDPIKQNMPRNTAGSLVNLGCQRVITVLMARLASDYKSARVYSLAISIFNTLSQLAQHRVHTVQISDVRHGNSVGEYLGTGCNAILANA